MSENVIEKQIAEIIDRAEGALDDDARIALEESADELQAATRAEQFMPPLSEWPEDAAYIVMLAAYHSGALFVYHDRNGARICRVKSGHTEAINLDIPPGIDPRIKVSREQMEAWEANQ